MSRTWTIIKREFGAMARTKAYILGTLFGPLLILGIFGFQILLSRTGGGERTVAIVDATGTDLGRQVALALAVPQLAGEAETSTTTWRTEVILPGDRAPDAVQLELEMRIAAGSLDGFLWLPPAVSAGETARYQGKNATNFAELAQIDAAVQRSVQTARLKAAGIDPDRVTTALARVPFEARKAGGGAASGTPVALFLLSYSLGLLVYTVVILYGNAVMRGVLEEKRDRIVEIIVSSVRSTHLMVGKVAGIGAAGLLQVLIWVAAAALVFSRGEAIAARFGAPAFELPSVPPGVGAIFAFFFLGGFFLYAGMYAAVGAVATTDQEAQQLQFPVILVMIVALLSMMTVASDPDGTVSTAFSIFPLTAPVVMPMRGVLTEVPALQLGASVLLLIGTALGCLWLGAKIYRIGILATGKRPSAGELWRWLRTA